MRNSRKFSATLILVGALLGACKMGGGPACPNHPTSATSDTHPADNGNGGQGRDGQSCRTRQ